jgi:hypothetical protein
MRFNPRDASRFPSPDDWLKDILLMIEADRVAAPPGQIMGEARKPALFMSNQARFEPGSSRNLAKFWKGKPQSGVPTPFVGRSGGMKGPFMETVLKELKKLRKLPPGPERKFVRNAIIQNLRFAELLDMASGDKTGLIRNMQKTGRQHAKYGYKFLDSMKGLAKSRSAPLIGIGLLAGIGTALGSIDNKTQTQA